MKAYPHGEQPHNAPEWMDAQHELSVSYLQRTYERGRREAERAIRLQKGPS
jgi:hypothetical protein